MHSTTLGSGEVCTRDSVTMYAKLPHNRLTAAVQQAIREAFAYQTQSMHATADRPVGFNIVHDNKGKCGADFAFDAPCTFDHVL